MNDKGVVVTGEGRVCSSIGIDGKGKTIFEFPQRISCLLGAPHITVGTAGQIFVLSPKGNLIGYLFPEGYESATATAVCYSITATEIAVAVGSIVLVYDLMKKLDSSLIALLEGHEAPVVDCKFLGCAGYEHLLVTCSEDHRFIVWDLKKRCLCFESPFESAHPIKGIGVFDTHQFFAIAFEDGFVRVYDASPILADKPSVRFVKSINLTKVELEENEEEDTVVSIVISKKKPPRLSPRPDVAGEPPPPIIATGVAWMDSREFLLCATTSTVIALNIATFERIVVYSFEEPVSTASFFEFIVAGKSAISNTIFVKQLEVGVSPQIGVALFPVVQPPEDSPLNTVIDLKTKQPVPIATLHKTVKSSGYTKPQSSRVVKKPTAKKPVKKSSEPPPVVTAFKLPKAIVNTFTPHETPLVTAALSADGKRTVCADNAGTIVLVQKKSTPAYLGHTHPVTALSWNTQRGFISASLDRTVKFWDIDRPDPLLTLNKTKSETRGTPFPEDITGASHFWRDKFVALATGFSVSLFGYHLPSLNTNAKSVADMHQAGTYKCVKRVKVDSGKIVSMAASNTPSSPIVLVATTGKSIHVISRFNQHKNFLFLFPLECWGTIGRLRHISPLRTDLPHL
jgi:WD40 repeat protein